MKSCCLSAFSCLIHRIYIEWLKLFFVLMICITPSVWASSDASFNPPEVFEDDVLYALTDVQNDVVISKHPERLKRHEKVKRAHDRKRLQIKSEQSKSFSFLNTYELALGHVRKIIGFTAFVAAWIVGFLMIFQIEIYYKNPKTVSIAHILMHLFVIGALVVVGYLL